MKTVNLTGSIIKKAPGNWSAFDGVSVQSSLDGTTYDNLNDGLVVDATSADADLKDLAASTVSYKLVNGNDIGMPNHADNPDAPKAGINITTLTPGKNMTYDSDLSSMKAYIPLSDWYKGFMTDDGTFKYTDVSTEKLSESPANGVTWDSANHRFVVDLNICGGHEIKIPSFTIGDHSADGKASYYNQGNTLDAVVPMSSVPADTSQTVDVSSRTDPTGSINTATFGFGSATDAQLTINSGDLTADDITFTPDLAENKINFTLTSSGEQKLRAGDLESNITIAAGGASVKLTLKLAESLDTWMPNVALQTALKSAGVTTLTKSNLASFNGPLDLNGISDLTGLEYARNLGSLKLTGCNLYGDGLGKTTNSQVLSKLTGLTSLEIDGSQLGDSLADWGLKDETNLAHITAQNDNLTDPGTSDYADDGNLESLNLSNNALNEDMSQVMGTWPKLSSFHLQNNQLTGNLPSFVDNPLLKQVYLSGNQLTGTIPDSYGSLTALNDLQLNDNKLSGSLPSTLGKAVALEVIYLQNNQFTGEIPSLAQLQKLRTVNLSSNQLTGSLPDLSSSSALKQVYLSNNQLTGSIPDSYGKLPNLSALQLNNNKLSGSLPAALGQDTALTSVYLNNNQFTGGIPKDWSALGSLQLLNLSANQLDGTLDGLSFANLADVNLNQNLFTGSLPESLFTSKLTSFQAANNQLSGDLPDLSKAVNLTTMNYGANKITGGTTLASASGNYQTWSVTDPDWKRSSDGSKMTLDLSKYYHGEQGQTGYQYIGISFPSIQGVTLDKTDTDHPLLTVDSSSAAVGNLTFHLFDQAGRDATETTDMNYMATITVPMWKTYAINIDTGSESKIDFGSPKVGTGVVKAQNFKLGISSTNAAGDSYQLTAQTAGLTSAEGHTVPVYYGNGQRQTLLSNVAQAIYNYQPTTNDDSTPVGDSQDATKSNLQTTIPATAYAGKYTGDITYTLASAPADDPTTAAKTSDAGQISPTTVSQMSPTLSGLPLEQEATRAKLQANMTKFVPKLADTDGVLYSGYLASQGKTDSPYQEFTESSGLWLLSLAMAGDESDFDTALNGIKARFYDSDTHTFNWQAKGQDHTVTQGSASIDDLRIIQALLVMNRKSPNNDRTALISELIDGFTKYDMNAYYQMIDGYSTKDGQEKRIRLDYLDLATLKTIYEAKRLGTTTGTAGGTAYQQQLKLIKDSYISDQLPMFNTYYNYSTGSYQVSDDNVSGQINVTDGLLTMLNLAKVGELPQTSLDWITAHTTADEKIYNDYNLDGSPASPYDAASNYAYVAQIAVALGDTKLYGQALTKLNAMTSTDTTSPLYGSAEAGGESYAFNDLNMLLAYNSVIAGS